MNILDRIMYKYGSFEKRVQILRREGTKIGSGCEIYGGVSFGSEPYLITLGNNVRITSGCKLITHDGGIWTLRKMKLLEDADIFGKINIGNNVHIGSNAIIMPNVTIGDNCIIGCGAIVTKDIPDNSIAVGVPAKVIENIYTYYNKHKKDCFMTKHMSKEEKKRYLLKNILM